MDRITDVFFTAQVADELATDRAKFPIKELGMSCLLKEASELIQALELWQHDKAPWSEVVLSAVQVAVMAQRVATEGDPFFDPSRASKALVPEPVCRNCRHYTGENCEAWGMTTWPSSSCHMFGHGASKAVAK
jgi:hypothetical protein